MIYHGSHLNIFATFSLMVLLTQFAFGQIQMNNNEDENTSLSVKGDLYGIFKSRLDKFNNGLTFNADSDGKLHTSNLTEKSPSVRECLYEEYKNRWDKINNEFSLTEEEQEFEPNSIYNSPLHKYNHKSVLRVNDRTGNIKLEDDDKDFKTGERRIHNSSEQNEVNLAKQRLQRDIDDNYFTYKTNDYGNIEYIDNDNDDGDDNEKMAKRDGDLEFLKFETDLQKRTNFDIGKIRRQTNFANNVLDIVPTVGSSAVPTSNDLSASYPSVLTKSFPMQINPSSKTPSNLALPVANNFNMKKLDLVNKLTAAMGQNAPNLENDPKVTETLQNYLTNTANLNTDERLHSLASQNVISWLTKNPDLLMYQQPQFQTSVKTQPQLQSELQLQHLNQTLFQRNTNSKPLALATPSKIPCPTNNSNPLHTQSQRTTTTNPIPVPQHHSLQFVQSPALSEIPALEQQINYTCLPNITTILENIIAKLGKMQNGGGGDKSNSTTSTSESEPDEDTQPDGAPCEIMGRWNSYVIGLRFDISPAPLKRTSFKLNKSRYKRINCPNNNILLKIVGLELEPPKEHSLMNTSWNFTGSSIKRYGGPLFVTAMKRSENMFATFAGFCRTCGGIDTIFGTWTFIYPSNDCQDVSLSIETKRDMLRRDLLEWKRKERLKEIQRAKEKGINNCLD